MATAGRRGGAIYCNMLRSDELMSSDEDQPRDSEGAELARSGPSQRARERLVLPVSNGRFHPIGRGGDILMLPDSDDRPARVGKRLVGRAVAPDVGVEFPSPPVSVRLGGRSVFGAAVPETAINEHGYPRSGEYDVWSDSAHLGEGHVYAVSESSAVEFASDGHFGGCVHVPYPAHLSRFGGRRWLRLCHDPDSTRSCRWGALCL